ncbi:hypothetical protein J31TS6_46570 [Brevibacillus reuszeri]|nr:hypothetical protein J31TS6_46570 [Brevibacillus reuszeri]
MRTNMLKFSFNNLVDSAAIVSKTIEDFPDPDTPVKIVIFLLGMCKDTFLRLFSRAPEMTIYS